MVDAAADATKEACLVAYAQQGDRSAFRDLYLATAPEVFAYARRRHSHHEAEDITAETFARAWRSLHTYRQQGRPFIAWLVRICQRVMVDRIQPPVRSTLVATDHGREPFDEVYARGNAVAGELANLPTRQQAVLELRFVQDLPVGDVAELMGLSPAGVRALTYRALETLRAQLDGSREAESDTGHGSNTLSAHTRT